jgi:Polyketide cyclase / dehydrase and lipid transport
MVAIRRDSRHQHGKTVATSTESNRMDLYATFPSPVKAVFGHLADPSRLGDWLPDISVVDAGPSDGTVADFPLTVHVDGTEVAASGEVTAFEPPWLVGYRLFVGSRTHGLRVTCAAQAGGTRVHVHQPDCAAPLTIDLAKLTRALDTAAGLSG